MVELVSDAFPVKDDIPPTNKFPVIPVPPVTISAPVVEEDEPVAFVIDVIPERVAVPPTTAAPDRARLPDIPTPPVTISAPEIFVNCV
jgi:hypothetical protein